MELVEAAAFLGANKPLLADAVGGYALGLLSRVFHTTCGATLLGGALYLRFVLAPAATGDDAEATLFAGRRSAWAACVGVCTLLMLLSGFYNFLTIVGANEKLAFPYHMVFGIKFLLAFAVFALSALVAGKSKGAVKLRGKLTLWLNVLVATTLGVFICGAVMRAVPHIPKPPAIESEAPAFDGGSAKEAADGPEIPTLPSL